jgi:hypothetical protein
MRQRTIDGLRSPKLCAKYGGGDRLFATALTQDSAPSRLQLIARYVVAIAK